MAKASRKTDWIFQRPGSANWWIKLRANGERIEKSLGTADREQAVILSLPLIARRSSWRRGPGSKRRGSIAKIRQITVKITHPV